MIINQINSKHWFKLNGLLRSILAHGGLLNFADIYVVTEYPKSGGTWLSQMLSEALEVPFPRNRLPYLGSCILHGHFRSSWNIKFPVVLWRDGRDVMVSQYHHIIHLLKQRKGYIGSAARNLNFSDIYDVQNNLPIFIEYMFETPDNNYTWTKFVDYWHEIPNSIETKYELLHQDTLGELIRILKLLSVKTFDSCKIKKIVQTYSFQNQANRRPGDENKNKFLRKGIVGDWKNNFSPLSCEIFKHYAGEQLIKLGYEKDYNWRPCQ